jgi:hypothetical protein
LLHDPDIFPSTAGQTKNPVGNEDWHRISQEPITGYLIYIAFQLDRSPLFGFQVGLFWAFLIPELLIDYSFQTKFRQVRWMVIAYVTFFFAATGGMIGVVRLEAAGQLRPSSHI